MRPIETMIPPIFDSPRPDNTGNITDVCWYTPALVFHPMYGTEVTVGNDHNIVVTVGSQARPTRVGLSAEMRAERPERPYGVRTGYVSRDFKELPASPWDNKWHTFKFEVPSHANYRFFWDGVKVLDVVERAPTTMYGANSLGLRLDFCDVEFDNMEVS